MRQISNEKKKNQLKTARKKRATIFCCCCLFVYFAEQLMAFDQYFDLFTLWCVTRFCKYDLILCCLEEIFFFFLILFKKSCSVTEEILCDSGLSIYQNLCCLNIPSSLIIFFYTK